MSIRLRLSIFVCSFSLLWTAAFGANLCYYPNGAQPTGDDWEPCSPSAVSACCDFTYGECSSIGGGLCHNTQENYLYVGACTDNTWKSDACPNYCENITSTKWQEVVSCPGNTYCCGTDTSCCTQSFSLHTSSPITNTPSNSTNSTSPSSSSSRGRRLGIGIGLGVGIPVVGGALFGVYVCIYGVPKWLRRRRRMAKDEDRRDGQTIEPVGKPGGQIAPQGQDQQPPAAMQGNRKLLERFKGQPVKEQQLQGQSAGGVAARQG